jgi:uncharacterized protein YndB with AHSA1/START domain
LKKAAGHMQLHKQIIIERNPVEVLQAFIFSRHTRQWWYGCETYFDLAAHSFSWQWRNPDGAFQYITHGRIKQYEAGLFLELEDVWQYDFQKTNPIGPVGLLLECTPQAGHTLLIVKHFGFNTGNLMWDEYYEAVDKGWDAVLPRLKEHLEKPATAWQ